MPTPANTSYKGRPQTIESGSYVLIPNSPLLQNLKSFTFQAMLWPTTPDSGTQAIVSKWQDRRRSGFALVIRAGRLALQLGDGKGNVEVVSTTKPLLARQWYFVAASYDAETRRVTLYQEPQTAYPTVSDAACVRKKTQLAQMGSNQAGLMFAALRTGSGHGKLDYKFNGKIDSPRLANRVLDRSEMERLKSGVPAHLQEERGWSLGFFPGYQCDRGDRYFSQSTAR